MSDDSNPTRNDGGQGDGAPVVQIVFDAATHTVNVGASGAGVDFYIAMLKMAERALLMWAMQQQLTQRPGVEIAHRIIDGKTFRGH